MLLWWLSKLAIQSGRYYDSTLSLVHQSKNTFVAVPVALLCIAVYIQPSNLRSVWLQGIQSVYLSTFTAWLKVTWCSESVHHYKITTYHSSSLALPGKIPRQSYHKPTKLGLQCQYTLQAWQHCLYGERRPSISQYWHEPCALHCRCTHFENRSTVGGIYTYGI